MATSQKSTTEQTEAARNARSEIQKRAWRRKMQQAKARARAGGGTPRTTPARTTNSTITYNADSDLCVVMHAAGNIVSYEPIAPSERQREFLGLVAGFRTSGVQLTTATRSRSRSHHKKPAARSRAGGGEQAKVMRAGA